MRGNRKEMVKFARPNRNGSRSGMWKLFSPEAPVMAARALKDALGYPSGSVHLKQLALSLPLEPLDSPYSHIASERRAN